jgi:hypothetical protein
MNLPFVHNVPYFLSVIYTSNFTLFPCRKNANMRIVREISHVCLPSPLKITAYTSSTILSLKSENKGRFVYANCSIGIFWVIGFSS